MINRLEELLKSLSDPENEYRPVSFWSWNDTLDPVRIAEQAKMQSQKGFGGFFMHARSGLDTPYMGQVWFDCVKAAIEEGKRSDIDCYVYDENGWPSGFGGGTVNGLGEEYLQKYLMLRTLSGDEILGMETAPDASNGRVLAVFAEDGRLLFDAQAKKPLEACLNESGKYFVVVKLANPYYVDLFQKKTVKAFLECTYQKYKDVLGEDFDRIKGVFTDEPQYGRYALPWSDVFPDEYARRTGREIGGDLLKLFFPQEGYHAVRYSYFKMMTELFTEAYARQIGEWCEANNLILTGHALFEEGLTLQCTSTGSVMNFYEHFQVPGMDWLSKTHGNAIAPRQVSSVCRQLSKRHALSEMYAGSSWDVSFTQLKTLAEWQYFEGIDTMCPHLLSYSLKGFRKRDWPPSLYFQTPFWKQFSHFTQYIARLGKLLTLGNRYARVLVVHTVRSAWCEFDPCFYDGFRLTEAQKELERSFNAVTDALTAHHVEFDYGDEDIMRRLAGVKDGRLCVGACGYDAVVIPSAVSLEESTLTLLESFCDAGGKVIYEGAFASTVGGAPDARTEALKQKCTEAKDPLGAVGLLEAWIESPLKLVGEGADRVLCHTQYCEGGAFYMLLNRSGSLLTLTLDAECKDGKKLFVFDAEKNTLTRQAAAYKNGRAALKITLVPDQCVVLAVGECATKETLAVDVFASPKSVLELPQNYKVTAHNDNAFTIDYCTVTADGAPIGKNMHVFDAQEALLALERTVDVVLEYEFESRAAAAVQLSVAVERLADFDVYLNGVPLDTSNAVFFVDEAISRIASDAPPLKGVNTVTLKGKFYNSPEQTAKIRRAKIFETEKNSMSYESEIEAIYLVGDFSVGADFFDGPKNTYGAKKLWLDTPRKNLVTDGRLTDKGFAFFAGETTLETEFTFDGKTCYGAAALEIPPPCAASFCLEVNGKVFEPKINPPYRFDITDVLRVGVNSVRITLLSTNRNLLGNHHCIEGNMEFLAMEFFYKDFGSFTPDYYFIEYGLEKPLKLLLY